MNTKQKQIKKMRRKEKLEIFKIGQEISKNIFTHKHLTNQIDNISNLRNKIMNSKYLTKKDKISGEKSCIFLLDKQKYFIQRVTESVLT